MHMFTRKRAAVIFIYLSIILFSRISVKRFRQGKNRIISVFF